MKEIRQYPVFSLVNKQLSSALEFKKNALLQKIDAAKEITNQVLELINNKKTRKLLHLLETKGPRQGLYSILDNDPELALIEFIILTGIEQYQNPNDDRVLSSLAYVIKAQAENAGYTQESDWEYAVQEISTLTNDFICINAKNQTTTVDMIGLSFFCDFTKTLPKKVSD